MLLNRRLFLATGTVSTLPAASMNSHPTKTHRIVNPEPIVFPTLPYPEDALEPFISKETLSVHFGKHHVGYFNRLHDLLQGRQADYDLPSLIQMMHAVLTRSRQAKTSKGIANAQDIYNAAGGLFSHNFYWRSMRPYESSNPKAPKGTLKDAIDRDFGDYSVLTAYLIKAATELFGSGWVWLTSDRRGKLKIVQTSNADTPLTMDLRPILVIDVWEHAYYIDRRNKRYEYVASLIDNLANWDFAEENFSRRW